MTIIDNINLLMGDDLKDSLHANSKLKIAASCFSIYAFEALKDELSQIESLEFIFTAPTFVPSQATDKLKKERREFYIPKRARERNLYGSEFEIQLRNKLSQKAIARECADWIRKKAKFRSNTSNAAMQDFACVQKESGEATVYNPLRGFTAVELGYQKSNAISSIVHRFADASATTTYLKLFDDIWNSSDKLENVTAAVCDHISSVYQENSPERIYFSILYNIFNEFLEDINEDNLPNDRTGYQNTQIWQKLFNFQHDAAVGIINKLETYNGCILADSVGLGKTFTALAVVKYYELRNRSVLVLCPKKLAENWLNYNRNLKTNIFSRDRFNYDVLCHTDLSRTSGESLGMPLNRVNWGNYDLVVIDESHNFRTNDAYRERETRYQKLMNQVIRAGVKTKVLMLSATPVNNRFNDLRNQLALAYEGDSENLSQKLRTDHSVEDIFRRAQAAFNQWSRLPSDQRTAAAILETLEFDFFELLDSVTIARSRKHIQHFYDTSEIGHFPERCKPISLHTKLTDREDVLSLDDIFAQLSQLGLAIYGPMRYVLPSRLRKYEELYDTLMEGGRSRLRHADRERNLQSLMTTNLLKRLESSVEAFRITLQNLKDNHENVLRKIKAFHERADGFVSDWTESLETLDGEEDDLSSSEEELVGKKVKINLADMDLPSWKHELESDMTIIDNLLNSMSQIAPCDDIKLQQLKTLILNKISKPLNPGNRKVLIFTAFADTANYLYDNLADHLQTRMGLNTGKVTGQDSPTSTLTKSYDYQSILTLFSPISKDKDAVLPEETAEIDILIGTDCISEGQNLQDCDFLINYDIHWNPVRIIQRFGRIDRIGSPNKKIQLVNFWPDISLDEYINLKERVENRMVIADVTATGDDNVLTSQSSDITYRKEQLRRLQDEVIELEDVKTGISITDLGLNDFRMDLLNYIKTHGDLEAAPHGMHAVVPAQPDLGLAPGIIFALRNCNQEVNVRQHNRLHPYYLMYISEDGHIVANHTEVKRLLDLVRLSCRGEDKAIQAVCRLFNQSTDEGRDMTKYSELLGQAIRSIIDVKEQKDVDSLFTAGKTTALLDRIRGLDDFELIAFVVVQEVKR